MLHEVDQYKMGRHKGKRGRTKDWKKEKGEVKDRDSNLTLNNSSSQNGNHTIHFKFKCCTV